MNNFPFLFPIVIAIMFTIMFLTMFSGNLFRLFHLVDKRGFLTKESYEKVNVLMANGDLSFHGSEGYEGKRFNYVSVSYKRKTGENVSKTFMGEDLNKMVDEAFDWATKEGYLETKKSK